jgi:hypothetical protein
MQHDHRRPGPEHFLHRRDGLCKSGQACDAGARRDRKARRRVDMARRTLRPPHHSRPPADGRQCLAQEEHHPILGVRVLFLPGFTARLKHYLLSQRRDVSGRRWCRIRLEEQQARASPTGTVVFFPLHPHRGLLDPSD